ncbi:myo-inositol 2-dehydrogenase / D-chiro-inositol 1-dehydrogenase [Nocardioides scoriae]|uniref:Myo-inositol 2-dehydrogenase / D-chiro-inositol 1-dehydrogenase n=1 Tax=Nocardioides scoriae TaxID=642780 RepID=A0A1H1NZY9_9ACTN|nr:Gfo/Idh/MocA family oxidoreductase [Nocardioides scoriae]SDS03919.1 myo-inositol 2-dehydrogenase / D-chiro-inositol 1-dehydrogenase [Nocardioides scoriae]
MSGVLRVGVIGAGAMGASHVRTLSESVPAARVTAVYDRDVARAGEVAGAVGAVATDSAEALVASGEVDAVVVASPDFTHADLAVACIDAGKPVLCEKPLAVTAKDALRVVEAEVAGGRQLVQVGFMRRFDPGFLALRRHVADGTLGEVRLVHAVHRNATNSTSTDDATLVTGSMVHELDIVPWLLDDPLVGIRVESPVAEGFRDPQLATLWTRSGVMVTVDIFANAAYGYDVRCEVVGTRGTAALSPVAPVSLRAAGREGTALGQDFVAHFLEAYRVELSAWAEAAARGGVDGPSAWDGYLANVAAEAGVASLSTGSREVIDPGERPALYAG